MARLTQECRRVFWIDESFTAFLGFGRRAKTLVKSTKVKSNATLTPKLITIPKWMMGKIFEKLRLKKPIIVVSTANKLGASLLRRVA